MSKLRLEDSTFKLFEKKLLQQTAFLPHEKILIAVSGGVDSVVLYDLLSRFGEKYSLQLCVAHVNHKMRGKASEGDALFVKKLTQKKKHTFFIKTLNPLRLKKSNFQAAARKARYDFFIQVAKKQGISKVFLAHQATDQIETFFLSLLRASPPSTWAMDFISTTQELEWIRPLLFLERQEIHDYAQMKKLEWREDSSNQEELYLRNYLRLNILPCFKKIHPQVLSNIARSLVQLKNNEHSLSFLMNLAFQKDVQFKKGEVVLPRKKMEAYPHFVRLNEYYFILKKVLLNPSKIKHEHLDFIEEIHRSNNARARASLPEGWGVYIRNNALVFKRWRVKNLKKRGFFVAP